MTDNNAIHTLLASADPATLRALLVLAFDAGYAEASGYAEVPSDTPIASWVNAARDAWYAQQETLRAQADPRAPSWLVELPTRRPAFPGIPEEDR